MKRSQAFPSRYLAQADVATPLVATIAGVQKEKLRSDNGEEEKNVMTFAEVTVKPMVLNTINWSACEAAFGEDSDDWQDKQIEIYADPNVMFGRERTGGVRLRIPGPVRRPAGPAPHNGNGNGKPAQSPQPSLAVRFTEASDGLLGCTTVENLNRWLAWAQKIPFSPTQADALEQLYDECTRRLVIPAPALAAVQDDGAMGDDSDVPF